VFCNRVLRRIFGPKNREVTEEWRILHNEELNDFYLSPNISGDQRKKNGMGMICSMCEEEEKCKHNFGGET
jgi:hypothetical protein